jgi:hypothetical protein
MIRSIRIRKLVGEILSFLFFCFPFFFDFPKDTQGRGKTGGTIQGEVIGARSRGGRRTCDAEGKRCGGALGFEGKNGKRTQSNQQQLNA